MIKISMTPQVYSYDTLTNGLMIDFLSTDTVDPSYTFNIQSKIWSATKYKPFHF